MTPGRLSRADLAHRFSESLGREKADQVVAEAARAVGIAGDSYDKDQALRILEHLIAQPGLVGIVARFAKVRTILQLK